MLAKLPNSGFVVYHCHVQGQKLKKLQGIGVPREVPAGCAGTQLVHYSKVQYSTGAQGGARTLYRDTVSTLLHPDVATCMMVVL